MPTNYKNIDAVIICNNVGIINKFKNFIPLKADPKLSPIEYTLDETTVDELDPNSDKVLVLHLCFNEETERASTLASLRGSEGMFRSCESGSYIRTTTNDHEYPEEERTGDKREFQCGRDDIEVYNEDFINGTSQGRVYVTI